MIFDREQNELRTLRKAKAAAEQQLIGREEIEGLGILDSPEFSDLQISSLDTDAGLGNVAKSLKSYVTRLWALLSGHTGLTTAAHGGIEPAIGAGTATQYWRGDKTWRTLNQAAVPGLTTTDSVTFSRLTLVGADPEVTGGQGVATIQDSTAFAAGVGGSLVFRGMYTSSASAGFVAVKAGKANATSGNLDTYAAIYTRHNTAGLTERVRIDKDGFVGIGTQAPKSPLHVVNLPVYANNAAALAGGLTAGAFYRTGADPDPVCVVH